MNLGYTKEISDVLPAGKIEDPIALNLGDLKSEIKGKAKAGPDVCFFDDYEVTYNFPKAIPGQCGRNTFREMLAMMGYNEKEVNIDKLEMKFSFLPVYKKGSKKTEIDHLYMHDSSGQRDRDYPICDGDMISIDGKQYQVFIDGLNVFLQEGNDGDYTVFLLPSLLAGKKWKLSFRETSRSYCIPPKCDAKDPIRGVKQNNDGKSYSWKSGRYEQTRGPYKGYISYEIDKSGDNITKMRNELIQIMQREGNDMMPLYFERKEYEQKRRSQTSAYHVVWVHLVYDKQRTPYLLIFDSTFLNPKKSCLSNDVIGSIENKGGVVKDHIVTEFSPYILSLDVLGTHHVVFSPYTGYSSGERVFDKTDISYK